MAELTESQLQLAGMIVEVLNLEDVTAAEIDPDAPLFDGGLGLDSIDALEIAVAVAQNYDVHLKAEDEETQSIFATLRSLSDYVGEHGKPAQSSV
jgi:acyl carrier protein